MRRCRCIAFMLLAPVLSACASVARAPETTSATAVMRDAAGTTVGSLRFQAGPTGTRINGSVTGLSAGAHGLHLHAVGRCDAPEFTSAGPHLSSGALKHGLLNPEGPHEGDLPAIAAGANGAAIVDVITPRLTLASAGPGALLDADGAAIVVHAANDDQRTDPSGNSGARIACGVVERN
jgi:superoxide dismutase, Cu-Zn family